MIKLRSFNKAALRQEIDKAPGALRGMPFAKTLRQYTEGLQSGNVELPLNVYRDLCLRLRISPLQILEPVVFVAGTLVMRNDLRLTA